MASKTKTTSSFFGLNKRNQSLTNAEKRAESASSLASSRFNKSSRESNNELKNMQKLIREELKGQSISKSRETELNALLNSNLALSAALDNKNADVKNLVKVALRYQTNLERSLESSSDADYKKDLEQTLLSFRESMAESLEHAFEAQKSNENAKGEARARALGKLGTYESLADTITSPFGILGKTLGSAFDLSGKLEKTFAKRLTKKVQRPNLGDYEAKYGGDTTDEKEESDENQSATAGENALASQVSDIHAATSERCCANNVAIDNGNKLDRLANSISGNREQEAVARDNQQDFMRRSLTTNQNIERSLRGIGTKGIAGLFSDFFGGNSFLGRIVGFIPKLLKMAGPAALVAAAGYAGYKFGEWLNETFDLSTKIGDAIDWVKDSFSEATSWLKGGWDGLKDFFMGNVAKPAVDTYNKIKNKVGDGIEYVAEKGSGILSGIKNTYNSAVGSTSDLMTAGANATNTAYNSTVSLASAGIESSAGALKNAGGTISKNTKALFARAMGTDVGGKSIGQIIASAASRFGIDPNLMMAIAGQESGFNPNASAKTSSAKGLFQFIDKTWAGMVNKYGNKLGIGIGDVNNPEANATMAALAMRDYKTFLIKNNISPTPTAMYAMHFLGPEGARKLFTANENANAASILPSAASSNPQIFQHGKASIAEVKQFLFNKTEPLVGQYAALSGSATSGSLPSSSIAKAGDSIPQVASAAPLPTPSTSGGNTASAGNQTDIDSIPMIVNEMGLVVTTLGNLG